MASKQTTPWATKAVYSQGKLLRVEPAVKPARTPWSPRQESAPPKVIYPKLKHPAVPFQPHVPDMPKFVPPQDEPQAEKPKRPPQGPGKRLVSARNYTAVEAVSERFGLIDMGLHQGARSLLLHVRKSVRPAHSVLNGIRPGSMITAKKGARRAVLRVRFITPARYYSPGAQITTLAVAVDESDWQGLVNGTSHV
jgi:hypothetical protein